MTTDNRPESGRRSSLAVASGILLSRLSGLVRESTIAAFLGTSFAGDAFKAALKIPNLLQNLLGEGVLSASFIPVYAKLLAEGRDEEAGRVAGAIVGILVVLTGALVLAGVALARPLTELLAPGFAGQRLDLCVTLVRIMTPGVGLLVLSAWCLGVLNSHRRFFLSYVAPVLWNASQVAALLTVGLLLAGGAAGTDARAVTLERMAVALAWGTLVGGGLQLAVQLPVVVRLSRGLRPSLRTDLPGVRRAVRAFGPVVAGRGVVQLSAYVDLWLASFLAAGAVAALTYAQMLYTLPISLFGMSVAAAELPELARAGAEEPATVRRRLDESLARIAFYVVPSMVVFTVAGDLLVAALYQRGRFGPDATLLVWVVLLGYTVGLLASTASRLCQSALYGLSDPRTPAKVAAVRVVLSGIAGAALMLSLERLGVVDGRLVVVGALDGDVVAGQRLGAAGLSFAAGGTAWLEYILLRRAVNRRIGRMRLAGGQLWPLALAGLAAAAVALATRALASGLPPLASAPLAVAVAAGTYLGATAAFRVPEAAAVTAAVRRAASRPAR